LYGITIIIKAEASQLWVDGNLKAKVNEIHPSRPYVRKKESGTDRVDACSSLHPLPVPNNFKFNKHASEPLAQPQLTSNLNNRGYGKSDYKIILSSEQGGPKNLLPVETSRDQGHHFIDWAPWCQYAQSQSE